MTTVKIPSILRKFSNGKGNVECEGNNVKEIIENLNVVCPGIRDRIFDEKGNIRRFVNIYINKNDVRFLNGLETKVNKADEILIVPAVSGG